MSKTLVEGDLSHFCGTIRRTSQGFAFSVSSQVVLRSNAARTLNAVAARRRRRMDARPVFMDPTVEAGPTG
jgi:hypothetical protein